MGRSIGKEVWFLLMPTLLSITFAMQWTPSHLVVGSRTDNGN